MALMDYEIRLKLQTANHFIESSVFDLKHAAYCLQKAGSHHAADDLGCVVQGLLAVAEESERKIALSYHTKGKE